MNQIGELIEKKDPQVRTECSTTEAVDSSGSGEATSCILIVQSCKPDVMLVNMIGGEIMSLTGSDGWLKVNALCEMSITNLSGNMTIKGTLQQKYYIMFMEQDDQSFNPTIFFSGNSFRFHVFDCTVLLHL